MEKLTRLKDGSYIGVATLEIDMIPAASNLDADTNVALKKNMTMFAEMVNVVAHGSNQQDTVLEILCITKSISGQTYEAQPHIFIAVRKFGRNPTSIEQKLKAFCDNCSASLQSSSYTVNTADQS